MKFNFGTGIALVYGIFAVGMVTMVMISRQHDPGLVQKDYYNLDLNYQAHLNGKQNTAALTVQPKVTVDEAKQVVLLQFPEGMVATGGNVKVFRSSTVNDDLLFTLNNQQQLEIPASKMASGRWHLEVTWTSSDKNYYYETAFNI